MIKLFLKHHYTSIFIKHFNKFKHITILRKLGYGAYNKENDYIHNLLTKHPNYNKTIIDIEKLVGKCSGNNFIENLEDTNILPCKQNFKTRPSNVFLNLIKFLEDCEKLDLDIAFNNIKSIINKLNQLSDNELIEVLLIIVGTQSLHLESHFSKNFSIFRNLARECTKRVKRWNTDQLLLVSDICFSLGGPFYTIILPYALKTINAKPKHLSPYNLVQIFFYVGTLRNYNFANQKDEIEKRILETYEYLDIEELSIIALGFFKSQNKIENTNLLSKIIESTIIYKKNISDFALIALLKSLQYSFDEKNLFHPKLCSLFLKEIKSEIKMKSPYILIRLATLGNNLNFYEDELLQEIIKILLPHFADLRLKELDRICFTIMNSRIKLKNIQLFIQSIEKELQNPQREEEIEKYFYSFVACIYYMACMGYYLLLISKALNPPIFLQGKSINILNLLVNTNFRMQLKRVTFRLYKLFLANL